MRIVFTGSQGTGKTVTCQKMAQLERFKNFYVPPSSARSLKYLGINEQGGPLGQLLIAVDRTNNISSNEDVISERSAIDTWAYTEYSKRYSPHWDNVIEEYFSITDELVVRSMKDVDYLVYFPVYWPPAHDGTRSLDPHYQKFIDSLIQEGINKFWNGPVITVENNSVAERVAKITDRIDGLT